MDKGYMGLAARFTVPDVGAVARSLLGVLLVAAIAVQFGSAGSATAATAAAAIAGATALQDSPRGPVPLVIAVSLAMGVAVALGTLTSAYPIVFVLIVATWCFAAGMQWAFGANAGLIAAAASALLVTAPPVTPSPTVVATAVGLTVAGGLAQAALIAVWPRRRWQVQRAALTRAYRALGDDARRMAADSEAQIDPAPLLHLREAFTLSDRQSRRRPLEYREWYGLPERIAVTLTALSGRASGAPVRELLAAAADSLDAIAGRARRDTDGGLDRVVVATAALSGSDATVAQRLSQQLDEAAALRFGEPSPVPSRLTRLRRPDLGVAARAGLDELRGQLRRTSPILRHAIRLSAAAAVGVAFARFAGIEHGYWIPLTVVIVLRPETAHTYTRCVGRLAGNAAGIVVASAVTMLWHPTGMAAAALAILCIGLAYAISGFGYVALTAALAAAIVFFIDISSVAGAATLADRLWATVIGGGLAVIAHVLLPDDALVRLRQRAGELLKAEIDYAATVVKAFVHDLDHPAEALSAAWQRAFRSRSAFEAASGTTRVESRDLRLWLRSYRSALNAITAACTSLESNLPNRPPAALTAEFVAAVDDYVFVLRGGSPDPATPWSVDTAALAAVNQRVRDAASSLASDNGAARVLVAEIAAITSHLARISPDNQVPATD